MSQKSTRFSKAPSVSAPKATSTARGSSIAGIHARYGSIATVAPNARAPVMDTSVADLLKIQAGVAENEAMTKQKQRELRAKEENRVNYSTAKNEIFSELTGYYEKASSEVEDAFLVNGTDVWQDGQTYIQNGMAPYLADDSPAWSNSSYLALTEDQQDIMKADYRGQFAVTAAKEESRIRTSANRIRTDRNNTELSQTVGSMRFIQDEEGGLTGVDGKSGHIAEAVGSFIQSNYNNLDKGFALTRDLFHNIISNNITPTTDPEDSQAFKESLLKEFKDPNGNSFLNAKDIQRVDTFLKEQAKFVGQNKVADLDSILSIAGNEYQSYPKSQRTTQAASNAVTRQVDALLEKQAVSAKYGLPFTQGDTDKLFQLQIRQASVSDINQETKENFENNTTTLTRQMSDPIYKNRPISGLVTEQEALGTYSQGIRDFLEDAPESLSLVKRAILVDALELSEEMVNNSPPEDISRRVMTPQVLSSYASGQTTVAQIGATIASWGGEFVPPADSALRGKMIQDLQTLRDDGNLLNKVERYGVNTVLNGFLAAKDVDSQTALQILSGVEIEDLSNSVPLSEDQKVYGSKYTGYLRALAPGKSAVQENTSKHLKVLEGHTFDKLFNGDVNFQKLVNTYEGMNEEAPDKDFRLEDIQKRVESEVLKTLDRIEVRYGYGSVEYPKYSEVGAYGPAYRQAFFTNGPNVAPVYYIPTKVDEVFKSAAKEVGGVAPANIRPGAVGALTWSDPQPLINSIANSEWPENSRSLKDSLIQRLQIINDAGGGKKQIVKAYETFYRDLQNNSEFKTDAFGNMRIVSQVDGQGTNTAISDALSIDSLHFLVDDELSEIIEENESEIDDINMGFLGDAWAWATGAQGDEKVIAGFLDNPLLKTSKSDPLLKMQVDSDIFYAGSGGVLQAMNQHIPMTEDWDLGGAQKIGDNVWKMEIGPFRGIRMEGALGDMVRSTSRDKRLHASEDAEGQQAAHLLTRSFAPLVQDVSTQNLDHLGNIVPAAGYLNVNVMEGIETQVRPETRKFMEFHKDKGYKVRMTVGSALKDKAMFTPGGLSDNTQRRNSLVGLEVSIEITDAEGNIVPSTVDADGNSVHEGSWRYEVADEKTLKLFERFGLK